jgi:N-acylneuraminate cytidylyltransferase
MTSRIAIIPARGGSKRIPNKNIKSFHGRPMISWAIEAAQNSGLFSSVIISTDSDEIAEVGEMYGAEVPFRRPHELADDLIGTSPVIKHALEWYVANRGMPDLVCTIYPTAVFLQQEDLLGALDLLDESRAEIVFSGAEYAYPIQRAVYINTNGRVSMFDPEHYSSRSQDLRKAYHDAGQFYLAKPEAILNELSTFSENSAVYVLPRYRVVDIDTEEDWEVAERLFAIGKIT